MTNDAQTFWLENLQQADRYNNWIFEQIKPYLGNSVLEVGCGNGNFTVFLAKECSSVMGIDLDSEYVELARTRLQQKTLAQKTEINIIQGDVLELDTDQRFDAIALLDVLEHIEDDVAILQKLNRLLKPGGNLIVKVPALNSLYGEMDRAIGHYRRYSNRTIAETFAKANLSVPKTWYFNLAGIPGWWLNSVLLQKTNPPAGQVGLFNRVVPILEKLEKWVTPPVGLSLFAIAQSKE